MHRIKVRIFSLYLKISPELHYWKSENAINIALTMDEKY